MSFEEAAKLVADGLAELVIKKHRDYGKGNILDFGEYGVLLRVNDKLRRLKNLQGKEVNNEPIDDTWEDIAGYSIVALLLRKGWFGLPMESDPDWAGARHLNLEEEIGGD